VALTLSRRTLGQGLRNGMAVGIERAVDGLAKNRASGILVAVVFGKQMQCQRG
jgi:hypothetical protein